MNLDETLANVEHTVQQVSAALLATDAPELEQCSAKLRQAALDLSAALRYTDVSGLPASVAQRIKAVGDSVALQRESLARLAVLTDRQVAQVVPQSEDATYGSRPGSAARIYKAAG